MSSLPEVSHRFPAWHRLWVPSLQRHTQSCGACHASSVVTVTLTHCVESNTLGQDSAPSQFAVLWVWHHTDTVHSSRVLLVHLLRMCQSMCSDLSAAATHFLQTHMLPACCSYWLCCGTGAMQKHMMSMARTTLAPLLSMRSRSQTP